MHIYCILQVSACKVAAEESFECLHRGIASIAS